MRFKALLVSVFVLTASVLGSSASSKSAKANQQPTAKSCRCSPAFPGSIPHCGADGSIGGGGTMGGGGRPTGGG